MTFEFKHPNYYKKIKKESRLTNQSNDDMENHDEKIQSKKARKERLKKRIERNNTPWKDKIEQSTIMSEIKSIQELANEINELIGKKQ